MALNRALITLAPLMLLLLSFVHGSGWPLDYNEPPPLPFHQNHRHRHHSPVEHITQGPSYRPGDDEHQQPILRHHNHRHRHPTTTTSTTTTTIAPSTADTSFPASPEFAPATEHRLRHGNKLYQPFALIESREQDTSNKPRHRPPPPPTNTSETHHPSWSSETQQYAQRPLASVARKQPAGVFNLTRVMRRRYFDRDGLYSGVGRRLPISSTIAPPRTTSAATTTTTTTPPPAVRMRHHSNKEKLWPSAKSYAWNGGVPRKTAFDWNDDSTWSAKFDEEEDDDDDNKQDDVSEDTDDNNDQDDDDLDDELNNFNDNVQRTNAPKWTQNKEGTVKIQRAADLTYTKTTTVHHQRHQSSNRIAKSTRPMQGMLKSNAMPGRTSSGRRLNKPQLSMAPTSPLMADLDVMEFEYDDDTDDEDDAVVAAVASSSAASRKLHGGDAEGAELRGNAYTDEDDVFAKSYIPGQLTDHKMRKFGTEEAVRESRRQFDLNQVRASQHIMRITSALACNRPRPKIIPVQAVNDSTKKYKPHCTILHRCGDDTGCCGDAQRTCVPKSQENVDLYFFVSSGNRPGTIEKLTFSNHTECHCIWKSEEPNHAPPQALRRATVISCTCPKLFETVLQSDGSCRCDCSSGNVGCDWKKRGREHFSVVDRKCINEGRCNLPICEHGHYEKQLGRCPRKEEKFAKSLAYRPGH